MSVMGKIPIFLAMALLLVIGSAIGLRDDGSNTNASPSVPRHVAGTPRVPDAAADSGSSRVTELVEVGVDTQEIAAAPNGTSGQNRRGSLLKRLRRTELAADEMNLKSFLKKTDATDFVHSFNMAVRFGATGLENVRDPQDGMERLVTGVKGSGELTFGFRDLTPSQVRDALAYVRFDGELMKSTPEAALTPAEKEIGRRVRSCKNGACADCVSDPELRSAALKQLASQ